MPRGATHVSTLRRPAGSRVHAPQSRRRSPPVIRSSAVARGANAPCACGGACPRCQRSVAHSTSRTLGIAPAGSAHERQADAAARQLPGFSAAPRNAAPLSGAAAAINPGGGLPAAPAIVHEALASSAQSLEPRARAPLEARFRRSFAEVRIHTGALAARSADAVGAKAYTVGRDIVFGSGHYDPTTATGQQLLAHELMHVVQQSLGGPAVLQRQSERPIPDEGADEVGAMQSLSTAIPKAKRGKQTLPHMFCIFAQRPNKDSNFGHAWVGLIDPSERKKTWGFYPACSDGSSFARCSKGESFKIVSGMDVPGLVSGSDEHAVGDVAMFFIAKETYDRLMGELPQVDGATYNLHSHNCVDYVRDAAALHGITVPDFNLIDEPEELANWIPRAYNK